MTTQPGDISANAFAAFCAVIAKSGDFKERAGQSRMARIVADTLARGDLARKDADAATPVRSIAVIEAGTGVGKSLAASVPAIATAMARGTRVIFSTATVALQEQLMEKDLPRFAALMDRPFSFALAKGRGRYVCKLKLNSLVAGESWHADFFDDGLPDDGQPDPGAPAYKAPSESAIVLYKELARDLAAQRWNGEKDTLEMSDAALHWPDIAADRQSCTGKLCAQKEVCTYFQARKKLADANVIVVNHDLLLATLNSGALPKLEETLLILDEAHEFPDTASAQFRTSIDLSSLQWTDQLGKRFVKVATAIRYPHAQDASACISELRAALQRMQQMVVQLFAVDTRQTDQLIRFPNGAMPAAMVEPLKDLLGKSASVVAHMKELSLALRAEMQAGPNTHLSTMYSALGALSPRLSETLECLELLCANYAKPDAKWAQCDIQGGFIRVSLHASPIVAGDLLNAHFWPHVRSAVLTSATLTSCGSFRFFLEESGLLGKPGVTTEQVESPFDFPAQGELRIRRTVAAPKQMDEYNREVAALMAVDFAAVEHGALALFTSRAHMELVAQSLPETLRERVLRQGDMSKAALLREHRRRVDAGYASIILGLQSFGQGVDLPGYYCNTLFIGKLPFTPPSDPVDEAKAEWMLAAQRDPFAELSVPATGVRLAQWMGRLIRTESDHGTVICYDKRLCDTGYGKRMLKGTPPFRLTVV